LGEGLHEREKNHYGKKTRDMDTWPRKIIPMSEGETECREIGASREKPRGAKGKEKKKGGGKRISKNVWLLHGRRQKQKT